jgi:hypothetical protein
MAGRVAQVVGLGGLVLYAASLPAALACVVLRFRAARGTERQQLRWVATGAVVAVLLLLPLPGAERLLPDFLTGLAVLAVPVSVTVAVLRYRLWDLDRLISRTVTYAVVTALLVLPYLLILPVAARLREQVDLDALSAELLAVVDQTVAPTGAWLWLRPSAGPRSPT